MAPRTLNISMRVYGWLLLAYPVEFRRTFGDQMLQLFRDCYRAEAGSGSLPGFWFRTLIDLALTAPKERFEREGNFMNRRSDAIAMLGCFAIIVIAFLIQAYGRGNGVPPLILYILDPLVANGVVGNFIVFVLLKTTKLNPLRTALITFAAVHALLLLVTFVLAARVDPGFRPGPVVLGYVVSFLVWTGLHWAWRRSVVLYS